jgi:hypothetical protein
MTSHFHILQKGPLVRVGGGAYLKIPVYSNVVSNKTEGTDGDPLIGTAWRLSPRVTNATSFIDMPTCKRGSSETSMNM